MAHLRLLLGFDYGTRSIGVAVGQMITGQARELCNLKAENGIPKWEEIEKLIKEWQPDAMVVGMPLNMDGTPSEFCARAQKFANRLNGRFNLPVFTHDERLTTFEAKVTATTPSMPSPPNWCCKAGSTSTRLNLKPDIAFNCLTHLIVCARRSTHPARAF